MFPYSPKHSHSKTHQMSFKLQPLILSIESSFAFASFANKTVKSSTFRHSPCLKISPTGVLNHYFGRAVSVHKHYTLKAYGEVATHITNLGTRWEWSASHSICIKASLGNQMHQSLFITNFFVHST